MKSIFMAFFVLNGWNILQNLEGNSKDFTKNYKAFEQSFTNRTSVNFHEKITSSKLSDFSKEIVKYSALAQIGLALASVFLCGLLCPLTGLVYFLHEAVRQNFASIKCCQLDQLEPLALSVALFMGCFLMSCASCCKKSKCSNKTPEK